MRMPLILSCLAVLALAACDKGPDRAAKAETPAVRSGLTIKTDGAAPQTVPAAKGGKLAVLSADPAPVAAARPAPLPEPEPQRVAARDDSPYDDPRFDGDWRGEDRPPTPRECRRAERRGDPMADSLACRDVLGQHRSVEDNCMAADRAGDDFAFSRQCRRILGGY